MMKCQEGGLESLDVIKLYLAKNLTFRVFKKSGFWLNTIVL